jgi:glycerol-3-phosphate dehydrogenase subunit C
VITLKNISFDHCIKCTVCTIYCPVAKATPLFPGPKQSGPDAERLRIKDPHLVDASLKYCTNCKRCEVACPSDVQIADLIQHAKYNYVRKNFRMKFRDFWLSRMDIMGKVLNPFAPIVNFFTGRKIIKYVMDLLLGLSSERTFPRFEGTSFRSWFAKEEENQKKFKKKVQYFHGCSVNTMDHQVGKDMVTILNSLGYGVEIPQQVCCGVPAIANSDMDQAKRNARKNIASFSRSKNPIVITCSSGAYALKYEYSNFLEISDNPLAEKTWFITSFLSKVLSSGGSLKLHPVNLRVAYHAPCHLERMGGVIYTIEMLKKIPGLDLVILNSECCGLSGTYGFKNEYFEVSRSIGENLFQLIEDATPELVVTDCVTCKWQIETFTSYKVLHPVNLLAMALRGE